VSGRCALASPRLSEASVIGHWVLHSPFLPAQTGAEVRSQLRDLKRPSERARERQKARTMDASFLRLSWGWRSGLGGGGRVGYFSLFSFPLRRLDTSVSSTYFPFNPYCCLISIIPVRGNPRKYSHRYVTGPRLHIPAAHPQCIRASIVPTKKFK